METRQDNIHHDVFQAALDSLYHLWLSVFISSEPFAK